MPDLSGFEDLAALWRKHANDNATDDQFSRDAAFNSALNLCADQLTRELERVRADV